VKNGIFIIKMRSGYSIKANKRKEKKTKATFLPFTTITAPEDKIQHPE